MADLLQPCRFYRLQTCYADVSFFTKHAVYYFLLRKGFTEEESFNIVHNEYRPIGLSLTRITQPFDRNIYDQYGPVGSAEDSEGATYYYIIEQELVCSVKALVVPAQRPSSECVRRTADTPSCESPVKRIRFVKPHPTFRMELYPMQSGTNHISSFSQPISVLFLSDVRGSIDARKGDIKHFDSIVQLKDLLNELPYADMLTMGFNKGGKKGFRVGDIKTAIDSCPRILGKSMRIISKTPIFPPPFDERSQNRVYYNPLYETFADVLQKCPDIKYSPVRTEGFTLRVSDGVFFPENRAYRNLFQNLFNSYNDAHFDVRFLSLVFYHK